VGVGEKDSLSTSLTWPRSEVTRSPYLNGKELSNRETRSYDRGENPPPGTVCHLNYKEKKHLRGVSLFTKMNLIS